MDYRSILRCRSLPPLFFAAVLLTGAAGCKTQSTAGAKEFTTASSLEQAKSQIAKIDASCGMGLCHAKTDGQVTNRFLVTFAKETAALNHCLGLNSCQGQLSPTAAKSCLICVTTTNRNGIYQGTVRSGVVHDIIMAAGVKDIDDATYMPMPPTGLTGSGPVINANQADFEDLTHWLIQEQGTGFSNINALRPPPNSVIVKVTGTPNSTCNSVSPQVLATIADDFYIDGQPMLGCPSATAFPDDPKACLTSFKDAPQWADAQSPGVVVKVLRRLVGRKPTRYWTRTSSDGRFVSPGNGHIEDLQVDNRSISGQGVSYDPAYSPDNKFYAWPDKICAQWPLYDTKPATALTAFGINVAASHCTAANVLTYRSMGKDDSGDILALYGYTNENPGFPRNNQAQDAPHIDSDGGFSLSRITNGGATPTLTDDVLQVQTPFETDFQLSPSSKLLVARFLDGDARGYRLRLLRPDGKTLDPSNQSTTAAICMHGEKANVSYDNRFVTFHHYSDGSPQDNGILSRGVANIFVYDLKTQRSIRVTNMEASGDQAFFPHFRADGWIYFLVKEQNGVETIAATNAALLLASTPSAGQPAPTSGKSP